MLGVMWLGLMPWSPTARAEGISEEARRAFADALEAIDLGRHAQAVPLLRRAVELEPRESEERVFLSGVFSRPYLPHFYLGSALASVAFGESMAHDPCVDAVKHLRSSRRQGVVQTFERLFAELEEAEALCLGRLVPAAEGRAREQLRRAEAAAAAMDGRPPTSEQRRALVDLDAARGAVESAASAGELDGLEAAAELARTTAEAFELLADRAADSRAGSSGASASDAMALAEARSRASRALDSAEREERRLLEVLADPAHAAARRARPDLGNAETERAALEDLRSRLDVASTPGELAAVESEAGSVARRLATVHTETRRALESRTAGDSPEESLPEPVGPGPAEEGRPAVDTTAAREQRRLRQLASEAGTLLGRLSGRSPESPGHLYQLQTGRLASLRGEALELLSEESVPVSSQSLLAGRLTASLDALRLIAAAHYLFQGEPVTTLELLDETTGDLERPLTAQRHLLRAAAHHQLYHLSGELDLDHRRQAAEAVRAARALAPDLSPDPTSFPPTFRIFYQALP
ncbi:MAG: hypothetical protein MI919_14060 [Holophagales bacterium]|nr:hypothetical protein [Holophagales bacterium]